MRSATRGVLLGAPNGLVNLPSFVESAGASLGEQPSME
jgi:hypothetical protein